VPSDLEEETWETVKKIILLQYNARPRTADLLKATLAREIMNCLPYSPYLAPQWSLFFLDQ
jgi:hypothetical protein